MAESLERSKYLGMILAAGRGSRMYAFSDQYPKPILPVGNKPLMLHQIELMRTLGITEILVLIGHKGYQITRVLGDGSKYGVRLHYIEQTEVLGIAHAVGQMEPHVDRPFLLFLGDIFFIPAELTRMFTLLERQGGGAVLATKRESDPEAIRRNYSVTLNDDGRVVRVIEKPRHVTNNLKGVGLYLFDLHVFDAIRRTPRTAMRDEYEITDSIQVMINDGHPVSTAEAVHDDLNITFPEDLLHINLEYLRRNKLKTLVAENADIHPGAEIANSVIGSNVRIEHPTTIRNCVIFDDVTLSTNASIENAILTPLKTVRFGVGEHEVNEDHV